MRAGSGQWGPGRTARRPERGSAAVLVVVLFGVLSVGALLLAALGGAIVGQRRVESAADLGALAGASAAQRGEDACAAAAELVARNRAHVIACGIEGDVVSVRVSHPLRPLLGLRFTVSSRSRAGPAEAPPGSLSGSGSGSGSAP